MTRREARCEFGRLLASFILEANRRGYGAAPAEVGVKLVRRGSLVPDGQKAQYFDRTHMRSSLHYEYLAADVDLYDHDGRYIDKTDDPIWQEMGKWWLEQSVHARWGGDWDRDGKTEEGEEDGNHLSFNPFDKRG